MIECILDLFQKHILGRHRDRVRALYCCARYFGDASSAKSGPNPVTNSFKHLYMTYGACMCRERDTTHRILNRLR
jgi:hypothetical protein